MHIPDVTGFLLADARKTLIDWNQNVEIKEIVTKSPKDKNEFPVEEIRVIKQEFIDMTVILTIAHF